MSRTKLVLGASIVLVLLLGGGVFYFAGWGGTPLQAATMEEVPPAGLCPEGYSCAKRMDFQGGCSYVPCCPQGEPYCYEDTRSHISFPRYVSSSRGDCIRFAGQATPYCHVTPCAGTALCPSQDCVAQGDGEDETRPGPDVSGPCGGLIE